MLTEFSISLFFIVMQSIKSRKRIHNENHTLKMIIITELYWFYYYKLKRKQVLSYISVLIAAGITFILFSLVYFCNECIPLNGGNTNYGLKIVNTYENFLYEFGTC